ncbi:hypothetical protein M427DRAFT_214960 [Gonapodya prolifera JEL478]|uniref:Uncharacterized protein n=1 Tax=Gonapodya prolifera (strain JEL478) TaxID=1344416 RepID=A0A139A035_GONPJ|nr:hypothetical protein M427DRAFT_214960 [Gonapodya prolifera JEL478]|eukprot:KXS09723.1 hypothetical protein M427DRAFT_214960 [Gonapodya prolifera JEL478]
MFHGAFSPAIDRLIYVRDGRNATTIAEQHSLAAPADGLVPGTHWCGDSDVVVKYEVLDPSEEEGSSEGGVVDLQPRRTVVRVISVRVSLSWVASGLSVPSRPSQASATMNRNAEPTGFVSVRIIPVCKTRWTTLRKAVQDAKAASPLTDGENSSERLNDDASSADDLLWDPSDPRVLQYLDSDSQPVAELAAQLAAARWTPRMELEYWLSILGHHYSFEEVGGDLGPSVSESLENFDGIRNCIRKHDIPLRKEVVWKYSFAKRLLGGDSHTYTPKGCAEAIARAEIRYRTISFSVPGAVAAPVPAAQTPSSENASPMSLLSRPVWSLLGGIVGTRW